MKSGLFNCILILGAALTVTCGAVAQQKSATGSASEYGAKEALKPLPPAGPSHGRRTGIQTFLAFGS